MIDDWVPPDHILSIHDRTKKTVQEVVTYWERTGTLDRQETRVDLCVMYFMALAGSAFYSIQNRFAEDPVEVADLALDMLAEVGLKHTVPSHIAVTGAIWTKVQEVRQLISQLKSPSVTARAMSLGSLHQRGLLRSVQMETVKKGPMSWVPTAPVKAEEESTEEGAEDEVKPKKKSKKSKVELTPIATPTPEPPVEPEVPQLTFFKS